MRANGFQLKAHFVLDRHRRNRHNTTLPAAINAMVSYVWRQKYAVHI